MPSILLYFSWAFVILMVLAVLVPYMRGRSDLLTPWNLFLIGSADFVGLSAVMSASGERTQHYLDYTARDYFLYMAGVVVFYSTLFLTYHHMKLPRRWAGRTLRKWPPQTVPVLLLTASAGLVVAMLPIFPIPIVGVAQFGAILGANMPAIIVTLTFVAWYRHRGNPLLLGVFVGVSGLSLILSMYGITGRRQMVAVAIAIPASIYWLDLRYRSVRTNLTLAAVGAVVMVIFIGTYTNVRHRDLKAARDWSFVVETITMLPSEIVNIDLTQLAGQNAAEASLVAIHLYGDKFPHSPFHSVLFVLSNPIPRVLWKDKPVALGWLLPQEHYRLSHSQASWGPGIVGHGFHEGGLHMLVFYGILFGVGLRWFTELLQRQPGNPYLIGFFAASSGQIIGMPRGDIGTFMVQIIGAFLAMMVLNWVGRVCYGSGIVYARTDQFYPAAVPVDAAGANYRGSLGASTSTLY